jgi:tight adherence protein C
MSILPKSKPKTPKPAKPKNRKIPFKGTAASLSDRYISKDLLAQMDRAIKTVGGVDIDMPGTKGGLEMLLFTVHDVYEYMAAMLTYILFALMLVMYGILAGAGPVGPLMIAVAVIAYSISRYRKSVGDFKSKFESQLPAVIDSMIQGLAINMPIEQVISYIADTKSGVVAPFIRNLRDELYAGSPLNAALADVSAKTLSPDFERVARILSFRSETTEEMVHGLEQIRDNIETRLETQIIAKANNMENTMILPIMAGYVLPYLAIILYPMINDLLRFFNATAF